MFFMERDRRGNGVCYLRDKFLKDALQIRKPLTVCKGSAKILQQVILAFYTSHS